MFSLLKNITKKFDKYIGGIITYAYSKIIQMKVLNLLKSNNNSNFLTYYSSDKNYLSKLSHKYSSDKGSIEDEKGAWGWQAHTYTDFYSDLFDHCKENIKLVFECGIGSNDPKVPSNMTANGKPGASLRMWKDYFFNSQIYGADIDKNILFSEDRIKTFYVDQLNKESIDSMWSNIQKADFDLIIDDGLHTYEAAITLFQNSFKILRKNGLYIVEDLMGQELIKTFTFLKEYNPKVIFLNKKKNSSVNNNLIVIKKIF
jgi:hypothetical protein